MSDIVENEDWKLGCFLEWRPKAQHKVCPDCNGKGKIGGHFKDLDGPRDCMTCFTSGSISMHPKTVPPEIPADLREHMRRAWWDYFHDNPNRGNE